MKRSDPPTPGTLPTRAERPRRAVRPRLRDDAVLPEGFTLGRYRILRLLGAGGMGSVYEAVHTEMGKLVALKVLRDEAAADPQARARFLREAAASSRIQHPHVVNVIDYGAEGERPFIVMQLLRGEDLSDRLDRHPRGLPIAEAADILLAVCAGVFAAHGAGVIHRDLKPRNIFLARQSADEVSPRVLDFGISKVEDLTGGAPLTDPGALLGTTHYLAPEQVQGRPVDARTDQHALGVVLYECLTARRPYEGDTAPAVLRAIAAGAFVAPARLRPELPPALEAAVLRAMAPDPEQRFASARAFGAALLAHASAKKQVAWSDYYAAPAAAPAPAAPPAPSSGPPAARPAPLLDTQLLAAPPPRDPRLATRKSRRPAAAPPPPAAPPPTREHTPPPSAPQVAAAADTFTSPRPAHPLSAAQDGPRARSLLLPALAAVLVLATAGRLLMRLAEAPGDEPLRAADPLTAGSADAPLAPQTPAVAAPASDAAAPSSAAAAAPASPGSAPGPVAAVTFEIADAPPDLVALVDGVPVALPLRLPAGSPPFTVTFRAPGYETRLITVRPTDETILTLRLRPLPRPRAPVNLRPPLVPNQPVRSPSPGPILDI